MTMRPRFSGTFPVPCILSPLPHHTASLVFQVLLEKIRFVLVLVLKPPSDLSSITLAFVSFSFVAFLGNVF